MSSKTLDISLDKAAFNGKPALDGVGDNKGYSVATAVPVYKSPSGDFGVSVGAARESPWARHANHSVGIGFRWKF